MGPDRIVLKDHADLPLLGRLGRDRVVVEEDLAGIGRFQAGDDPGQGRLARAGRAEHQQQLAGDDLQRLSGIEIHDGDPFEPLHQAVEHDADHDR